MKIRMIFTTLALLNLSLLSASCKNKALVKTEDPRLKDIRLPQGFRISVFADEVNDARSMTLGDKGTVFVGNRQGDKVYALTDTDRDGVAEQKFTLISGLNMPNGVAFHNGALYIAEVSKIWRIDNIESNLANPGKPVLVTDQLPTDKHHGWKYIGFGPDGRLYIPVGAPCNICDDNEKDERYASIMSMNPDGTQLSVYAKGIRNTVGFAWHPQTKELWFTENGGDNLGDDVPADELNTAPRPGMHFGFPYCHQGDLIDKDHGKGHSCSEFIAPVVKLAPHTAALGMKFYTGTMFPEAYRNKIIIAEHGSWNRTDPIGYRLMMVSLNGNSSGTYEVFAEGWLKNGKAWGRPVDVLQLPDGSLLVSDDHANLIYRISYEGK